MASNNDLTDMQRRHASMLAGELDLELLWFHRLAHRVRIVMGRTPMLSPWSGPRRR
jgi:hypothetical protein